MNKFNEYFESIKKGLEEAIESAHKDQMKGGLADDAQPEDFDQEELTKGIKVELEHTDDEDIAREIAMDHLTEDPKYYTKLATIENH